MIDGLGPYPTYKASGSRWIGHVPSHWSLTKLGRLIERQDERNRPDLPLLSVARERGVFVRSTHDQNHNVIPDDLTNYKLARSGNLVINKMKAWQGSLGIAPCDGVVSPAYFVFRLQVEVPLFSQMLLRSRPYVAHFGEASDGVRVGQWDLSRVRMKAIPVALPPVDEQAAIVRFLDHTNHRIDAFIRGKRKLIALLNEQKLTAIRDALTVRAGPCSVPADPRLAWIGPVPNHWELVPLKRYWQVIDCKHLTVEFVDEGLPLASVREVKGFELDLSRCKRTTEPSYRMLIEGDRRPRRGDLLYCRNVNVGSSAVVTTDDPLAMGQDVCLIRSTHQNQRFLNYVMRSQFMTQQLELLLVGSTFRRINVADVKALLVMVPPRHEQDAICVHLDAVLAERDLAISRTEREIALMREYRARLIADVVTGQLDVREAAKNLPELDPTLTASGATDPELEPDALDDDGALDPEAE